MSPAEDPEYILGHAAGDVSLLAASIVGPSGSVTGVDMLPTR